MSEIKIVVCINDKNLPIGASIKQDETYEVEEEFINAWDQVTYILKGCKNHGRTLNGMEWKGYNALRFSTVVGENMKTAEFNHAMN